MKKIILDTNFILSCIRKKIDFFEELIEYKILIPEQVISELKKISESKKKLRFRDESKLALLLLKKSKFTNIDLKEKYVDKGIRNYLSKHPNVIVATLDKEVQLKTNSRLIIRGNKLELI